MTVEFDYEQFRAVRLKKLRRYIRVLLTTAIIATLALILVEVVAYVDFEEGGFDARLALFTMWTISPYLFFAVLIPKQNPKESRLTVYAIGISIISFVALAVYFNGFILGLDASSGFLFLSVPFFQWIGTVCITFVSLLSK